MANNNDLLFENTGAWDEAQLRRRDDLTIQPYFGYNVAENASRVRGTYRPIRNLPVLFKRGNRDDFEGFVFSQGKFLAKYDRLINSSGWTYQDDVQKLGVASISTGKFKAFTKADGTVQEASFENEYWNSHGDIEGFLMPANGTDYGCQDYFGTLDTLFSIINPVSGAAINSTTITGSGSKATLRNGLSQASTTAKLAGVAIADKFRETRNNSYQYQRDHEAITVAKSGYLRLPFVIASADHAGFLDTDFHIPGANVATLGNYTTATAFKQFLASRDQTALFIESPDLLVSGAKVCIDMWGNPVLSNNAAFADVAAISEAKIRLTDFNFEVRMPFGNETVQYPGIDVASANTGGIDFPVWALAKKLEDSTLTINELAELIIGGTDKWYGYATIYYEIP